MKMITAYRTADGTIHATQRAAHHHADELAGAVITKHAHALAQLSRYSKFIAYLETNAAELARIAPMLADRDNTEPEA